ITAYNKENPDKQVILIEYFEDLLPSAGSDMAMAFQESLEMAIRKFELDIIRDQAPDIVIFRQALSWNRYAELNIFEDLYPYLEADAFDWDNNLYEHIIKAYEVEGKLYGMPMISYPNTLIVRQADILNRGITEWNMDEFIAFVDSFESDKAIFANPTKTAVLDLCLFANGDVFVDWSSQDNVFNRNFITKILHFSNRFIDGNKYADNIPLDIRAQSGDVKLFSKLGASFPGWIPGSLNLHGVIMGEQVSYIGFPSENGSGVITHSEMLVSLTSQCRDKEAAWHFLSYYFTEALADKDFYKGLAERMRGSYQTHSDTSLSSSYSYYIDDDDINAWFGLFEGDVQIRIYDQTIENIIKEEAESYFSGGKSLDDVVDVIEKRVILYVHETS
ncbi:MAG: extracellular solute-binding protein, partial [Lachnospiraceae bacterium]|nr:extracellular solute-binding protein [Lachnospiraceae bacterium]